MSPKPGPTAHFCGYQEKSNESQAQERRNRLSRIQQLRVVERDNVRDRCDLYQNVIDERKGIREFEAKNQKRILLQQQYAELVDEWKRSLVNNGKAMKEAKETAVITQKRIYQKEYSNRLIAQHAKERNKTAAIELSKDRIPFETEEQRKIQYTTALRDMAKVQRENAHQTAESKHAKELEIEKQKQHDYYAHGKIIKHQVGAEQSAFSILDRGPVVVHALIHRHHLPSTAPNTTTTKLVYNAELEEDVSHRRLWKRVMSELTGKKKAKVRSKAAVKVRIQHKQVDHMEDELMMLHNVDRIGSRSNRAKSADVVPPDTQSPVLLSAFERIFLLNQNVDLVTKGSDAMSATTISSTPKHVVLSTSEVKSQIKELPPSPKRSSSPKVVMKSNNWTVVDDSSSIDDEEIDVAVENVLSGAPKWQSAVETSRSRKVVGKDTSSSLKSTLDAKKLQVSAPSWTAVATSGYGIEAEDPVDDVEMPRGALPRPFNKEDVWRNLPIEEAIVEKKFMPKMNTVVDWYECDDNNNDYGDDDDSLKVDENNYKQYFPYDEQSIHSSEAQKSFYEVHLPTIPISESVSPAVLSPQSSYKGESIQKEHHTLTPLLISTGMDNIDEQGEVDGSWLTEDNLSHRSYIGDEDDVVSRGLSSDASTDVARHDNETFFSDSKSALSDTSPPPYSVIDSYDRYASTESDVDRNNRDDSDEDEVLTPKPSPVSSPKTMSSSRVMTLIAPDLTEDVVASASKLSTSSSSINSIFQNIQDSVSSVNQSIHSEKTPFKEVAIDVLTGLADRSCEISPYPGVTEYSELSTTDSSVLSSSMKSEKAMTPMREAAVNTLTDLMNAPYETSRNSSARSSPSHVSNMSSSTNVSMKSPVSAGSTNVSMKSPLSAESLPGMSPRRQIAINSLTDLMNAPYETSRHSIRSSPVKSPLAVSMMSSSSSISRSPMRDVPMDLTPMKQEAINTLTDLMNAPYESSRSSPSKSPLSTHSHSYQSVNTTITRSPVNSELDITPARQSAINTLTDLMNAPYESSRSTPTSRRSPQYLSPSKSPLSNISQSYISNSTLTNSPPMHEASVDRLLKSQNNSSTDLAKSPRILSSSRGSATVSLMSNDSFDDSSSDNSSSMGSDGSPVREQQDRMVHDSLNSSYHSTVTSSTKSRPSNHSVSQSFHSKIIDIDTALLEINAELLNQSIAVDSISSSAHVSKVVAVERVIPSSPSAASSISSYSGYDKYTDHVNSAMFESPAKGDASSRALSNLEDEIDDDEIQMLPRMQPPNPFDYIDNDNYGSNIEITNGDDGDDYSDDRSESTVDEMPFSLLEVRAVSGTKAQSPIKISTSMTSSASERITLDHLLGNEGISSSNSNSALDISFASSSSAHSSYMTLNANNLALTGQVPKLSSPPRQGVQYDAARVRIREEIAGLKSHLINIVGTTNNQVNVSVDSVSSSEVSLGTLTKKHPLMNSFPTPDEASGYNNELYDPVNSPMGLRRTLGVNYLLGSEKDDSYDVIDEDSLVVSDISSSRLQNSTGKVSNTPVQVMGSTYDLTPMSLLSEGSLQQHLIQLSRRSNENNSASKYSILSGGNLSEGYTPTTDRFNPVDRSISPAVFNGGTQTSLSSGSIDSQEIIHDSLDDEDAESYRL